MNGSISLLRTNPALTTNIKLIVDTQYNLYLESYNANGTLSDIIFKKFQITADSFLSQRIATFYNGVPTDIAFDVKNDIKSDTIQTKYDNQFDDIYYSGARNVEDTRYLEEFQYNTTLRLNPNKLPKYFMIFRVDGPGTKKMINYSDLPITVDLTDLSAVQAYLIDNNAELISNYISEFNLITTFDLTPNTEFGKLWKKNYIDDDLLLRAPVELNFKKFEFSKWNGYDYMTGGTVSKSFIMNDIMQNQTTQFELDSFITNGFKKNSVISSHYSNISFLFDDTVSSVFYKAVNYYERDYPFISRYIQDGTITAAQYAKNVDPATTGPMLNQIYYTFTDNITYRRKWTINRYTGFYIDDIIYNDKISPYVPVFFNEKASIYIVNNVFRKYDPATSPLTNPSVNPVFGKYDTTFPIYFKINNELYLIEFHNNEYVLISNTIFNGSMNDFIYNAQKPIKIVYEDDSYGTFRSFIKYVDNTYYGNIDIKNNTDSIFVIKIVDKYYKLSTIDNKIYIKTDEIITCDTAKIYSKLGFNDANSVNINILTKDDTVTYFDIYKLKFTEIGDFDFTREETGYTGIEYNKSDAVNHKRPFLYTLDIKDTNVPREHYSEHNYNIWIDNNITTNLLYSGSFILPLSSEYAASGDLYMLNQVNNLTKIWDINQSMNKWSIYKSVNNMSYPYIINNSLDISGQYNFTPNLYSAYTDLKDITLDWFYTLGFPIDYTISDPSMLYTTTYDNIYNITERSLNIDLPIIFNSFDPLYMVDNFYKIDLDYYKNKKATIDYFDYIFNLPVYLKINDMSQKLVEYSRIAYFTDTDKVNGPAVFFKGLSAYIQYVHTDNPNSNDNFKTIPADDLSGYGFSILFSPRPTSSNESALLGKAGIEIILNKIYKNVLINIYVHTLEGTYTSLDYRERDKVYDEDYVYYTNYDGPLLNKIFYPSNLPVQSLTLKTMIDILANNRLVHKSFEQGIKYTVVDNLDEYKILSITPTYDSITNITSCVILFEKNMPLQHGDWIYLDLSGIPYSGSMPQILIDAISVFDTNHQIVTKNNNRSVTIQVHGDQTVINLPNTISVVAELQANISNIICTKEKSIYPFRLKVILPDEIKLDRTVNLVSGDTSCPVRPKNNYANDSDILINSSITIDDNLVPHVYVDDNISRRIQKINSKELTYTELNKLPSIFRYGGDYEPIINKLDLYKQSSLTCVNDNPMPHGINKLGQSRVVYIEQTQDTKKIISVHIASYLNSIYNDTLQQYNIKVGDIYYVRESDFDWLRYKTGHITKIEESTISNIVESSPINYVKVYKITLDLEFAADVLTDQLSTINGNQRNLALDSNTITQDGVIYNLLYPTGEDLFISLFRYNIANTEFEYNFTNFGSTKETIISKYYDNINPMQTSNDIYKTTNKYPMIDEHGVTSISRNLFKSSWDPNFYYRTASNKYVNK